MHTKVSEGDWVMGGGHPVYLPHLLRPAGQPGQGRHQDVQAGQRVL